MADDQSSKSLSVQVSDQVGLGRSVEKFLDVISTAIGVVYRPRAIRLEGKAKTDADVYATVELAKAKQLAKQIESEGAGIERRAARRLVTSEVRRQTNVEDVAELCLDLLRTEGRRNEQDAGANNEAHVEFVVRLIEEAKDCGDAYVKALWARILAEDFYGRGPCSPVLLASMRQTDREIARQFEQIRPFFDRYCFLHDHALSRHCGWDSRKRMVMEHLAYITRTPNVGFRLGRIDFDFMPANLPEGAIYALGAAGIELNAILQRYQPLSWQTHYSRGNFDADTYLTKLVDSEGEDTIVAGFAENIMDFGLSTQSGRLRLSLVDQNDGEAADFDYSFGSGTVDDGSLVDALDSFPKFTGELFPLEARLLRKVVVSEYANWTLAPRQKSNGGRKTKHTKAKRAKPSRAHRT